MTGKSTIDTFTPVPEITEVPVDAGEEIAGTGVTKYTETVAFGAFEVGVTEVFDKVEIVGETAVKAPGIIGDREHTVTVSRGNIRLVRKTDGEEEYQVDDDGDGIPEQHLQ